MCHGQSIGARYLIRMPGVKTRVAFRGMVITSSFTGIYIPILSPCQWDFMDFTTNHKSISHVNLTFFYVNLTYLLHPAAISAIFCLDPISGPRKAATSRRSCSGTRAGRPCGSSCWCSGTWRMAWRCLEMAWELAENTRFFLYFLGRF